MSNIVELAIIGAGPAGMSAAIAAREHGIDVLVLDEQAAPGGQIYRNVEAVTAERSNTARVLGEDYTAGAALARAFRECGARYSPRTSVWELSAVGRRADQEAPVEIGLLRDGIAEMVYAHCVIAATGAQERAVPAPGATLPGVMGAGGAQSLLKGSGLVPDVPVVIAGSGPLVYLVAYQLVCAGAPVRAVLFTTPPDRLWRAAGALPKALAMPGALRKGIGWRRALTRRGVKVMHVSDLAIEGEEQVESVRFTHRGRKRSMQASLVLLHEGVVPNAHLTLAAQLDHVWDDRQHAFLPAADEWGTTSEPGVLVAGDGAHILGAEAAVDSGRIAALEAAHRLGRVDAQRRDALAKPHRASLARHRRFREFLDLAFEPVRGGVTPVGPGGDGVPLRGGDSGRDRARDRPRVPGPQSGKGIHPLRHGAVPGPDVRDRGERDIRRTQAHGGREGGALPHPPAGQAADRRRARGTGRNRHRTGRPREHAHPAEACRAISPTKNQ